MKRSILSMTKAQKWPVQIGLYRVLTHEEEMFHAVQSGFTLLSGSVYLNCFGARVGYQNGFIPYWCQIDTFKTVLVTKQYFNLYLNESTHKTKPIHFLLCSNSNYTVR